MNLLNKIKNGVYVIAEMSANHAGSLSNALEIVEQAAKAGADCVKIQTYTADTLTIDCKEKEYMIRGGLWDGYNYYQLYQNAYTPWEWHEEIKKKCEQVGVDFLSTPFDRTAVDFLESLNVEFYKIASFELIDIPLIEYTASKGKPMILSCGMGSLEEIQEAVDACKREKNENIVLLKCCSEYPANYQDMNLSQIPEMKKIFEVPIGLSDHSMGSLAPVMAVALGAKVIEKHVCLSRKIKNPDSDFSMEIPEFVQMVQDVKNASLLLGDKRFQLTNYEEDSLKYRRSLVAVKPIRKGERFTSENIRSIRPSIGIRPKYLNQLIGQEAKKDYYFGEGISESEI